MSDALASALWVGDYMLMLHTAGCAGVNLHGGSREFLRASLGDHMPGEQLAKNGAGQNGQSATLDARIAKGGYYANCRRAGCRFYRKAYFLRHVSGESIHRYQHTRG